VKRLLVALLMLAASVGIADARKAFVVGINDYQNVPKLQKAVGDAQAMKTKLEQLGFSVELLLNPNFQQLNLGMARFANSLQPGDVALVHFSGHGVGLDGENFLLPADAPSPAQADKEALKSSGFALSSVVERLRQKNTSAQLLFIDACRDNPYAKNVTRAIGVQGGLIEQQRRPKGTFIVFSAGIGQQAADRLNDNDPEPTSVFMRGLLAKMPVEGKSIIDLVREVREDVEAMAARMSPPHEQRPAYYDELAGNFFFVSASNFSSSQGVAPQIPAPLRPAQPQPLPNLPTPVTNNPPVIQPTAPVFSQPSFDCSRARQVDEQAICNNASLSALDRTLSKIYYDYADTLQPADRAVLRREEEGWVVSRRNCGGSVPCIAQSYNSRIAVLLQRTAPAGAASVRPGFDCSKARRMDELTVCANAALAQRDLMLNDIYGRLRGSLAPESQRALSTQQAAWLAERGACQSNVACIAQAYDTRNRQLQNQMVAR
jgi:uncharacterized protein